jgi:hypothetical protein
LGNDLGKKQLESVSPLGGIIGIPAMIGSNAIGLFLKQLSELFDAELGHDNPTLRIELMKILPV